jgi:hypothetical protein
MSENVAEKFCVSEASDGFCLTRQYTTWDAAVELKKAEFMDHMYECSGRSVPGHPMHGLYTGLWQEFCVREAGPKMRDLYFEMKEAVRLYEQQQKQTVPVVIS